MTMGWVVEQLHRDGSVLARVFATTDRVTIGRALDNDLVLDDPHCAPHHARLEISSDSSVRLVDLGSINGIFKGRARATVHTIAVPDDIPAPSDQQTPPATFRLGNTLIRIRSRASTISPEVSLSRRAIWPLALLGLALALGNGAWDLWLKDTQESAPKYFYDLSAQAAVIAIWSAAYALFGRLISGAERFFSHLLIASIGYCTGAIVLDFLEVLAFACSWLWPIQITQPVIVVIMALTVRFHLRLADPRHWPSLRIAVALVAVFAMLIPIAQKWVSQDRITDVQTLSTIHHPALRMAAPITVQDFGAKTGTLKARVDAARKKDDEDADSDTPYYEYDP